jgi:ring-1,2-phenylacetyl-CoA epoxidase subunit PaaE
MVHKAHELAVSAIDFNTPETAVVTLSVPDDLKSDYIYKQGQHLTFIEEINSEEVRRSYSICSSVRDDELKVAIRKVKDGRFSTFATEKLAVGDKLKVMEPAGNFYVDLDASTSRTYVAFASGSGITPIISIIKTTLETEPNARFFLFYGNRTGRSTIFRDEISFLKNKYVDRFSFWHFLSQEDLEINFFRGRMDGEKVKGINEKLLNIKLVDHAFICGPEAMIDGVSQGLLDVGMAENKIHFEKFMSEGQTAALPDSTSVASGLAKLTLIIDDEEVTLNSDHKMSILDAAVEGGLDAPFACKGGVCCTCRAKVLKGEVEMVLNQGLEPEEVEAGYVLTCQSFAISEEVTLSYDD